MSTYRYLILKSKSFPGDIVIEDSIKKLKECKERLQHNIECYNNFLIQNLKGVKLLTANEAIKKSKEEELDLLKNEGLI